MMRRRNYFRYELCEAADLILSSAGRLRRPSKFKCRYRVASALDAMNDLRFFLAMILNTPPVSSASADDGRQASILSLGWLRQEMAATTREPHDYYFARAYLLRHDYQCIASAALRLLVTLEARPCRSFRHFADFTIACAAIKEPSD